MKETIHCIKKFYCIAMSISRAARILDYHILCSFLALLLVSLSATKAQVSEVSCDPGWTRYNEMCFKTYSDRVFKTLARMICKYDNAQLVSISSQETLKFLTDLVRPVAMDDFWVGLDLHNKQYIWEDSSNAENHSWVEKNSSNPRSCYYFNGEKVKEKSCMIHIGFICEQKIAQTEKGKCPENTKYASHMNLCLWVVPSAMPKAKSEEACTQHGGTMLGFDGLAKVGLHHLDDFLKTHTEFWTNITWNDTTPVWFDPITGAEKDLNISDVPTVFGDGSCTILGFVFTNLFPIRLYKVKCDATAHIICSAAPEEMNISSMVQSSTIGPITGEPSHRARDASYGNDFFRTPLSDKLECPHGYNWKEDFNTGYCYWETSYETPRISWADARAYCQTFGGDLASFHSVQEEKIGLSFQYGSMSHPYWIGITYNTTSSQFVWTDGSSMDYMNWAAGQPDHRNLRMRCVQMDAAKKEWTAAYCGMLSWFICKAPKQLNPKPPVLPTLKPLQPCLRTSSTGYFFEAYCYEAVSLQYDWHRARMNCQNRGSELVSVHSEAEVDFLIRLLYEEKSVFGNRVWIGLNSFGLGDQLGWSDNTLLDFVHWNKNEPNNFLNQEKCCNMYVGNGLWNDENCNSAMAFVCKRLNDTSAQTTLKPLVPTPAAGNCKKGWYAFEDNCYLPAGEKRKEWANFSAAHDNCRAQGGTLASIRNEREQVFITYLMQNIKENMWIGLHDTIQSGVYFWLDNSPITYTNWALGEPSLFGLQEDCVHLVYDSPESGSWKDEVCGKILPYMCQSQKDPSITSPWISRSSRCIQPEGWLKRGYSCFEVFKEEMSWLEAMDVCETYGAKLVSVSDFSSQAVVKYLALNLNTSIWIGLFANKDRKFNWLNGWPMSMSNWDTNEPAINGRSDLCFVSSTKGYWAIGDCEEKRPFICQITADQPPPKEKNALTCPSTAFKSLEGEYCYNIGDWLEGFNSYFQCFLKGGNLISIHSKEQINSLKDYLVPTNMTAFFIGLSRNKKGGFAWADGTAVDFENWADGEPQGSTDMCVEMKAPTFKWRVVSCTMKRNAICSIRKEKIQLVPDKESQEGRKSAGQHDRPNEVAFSTFSKGELAAVIISLLILFTVAGVAVFYYFKPHQRRHFRLRPSQITSFENELYEADLNLELREDQNTNLVPEQVG